MNKNKQKNNINVGCKIENINNNIIRKICIYMKNILNINFLFFNKYLMIIHYLIISLITFILIFNNNIIHLIITLIIVSIDGFAVVVLHGCPLTTLEKKYLKISSSKIVINKLKNSGIFYSCNHEYEKQIDLLTYAWIFFACKCLRIIFLKTFNIKLINYSSIYL